MKMTAIQVSMLMSSAADLGMQKTVNLLADDFVTGGGRHWINDRAWKNRMTRLHKLGWFVKGTSWVNDAAAA